MTGSAHSPTEAASRAQARAARPTHSVWVSANAGSGKTRVLTNRVARLLLAGADPARILCLTYTKAAAAEMQNRLFEMLGAWTMAEDADLAAALTALLAEGEPAPSAAQMGRARRLFARALETPGGLRIQTIHAFCESLLSRFPLEAGVSPHFEVIDEAAAEALIAESRDAAVAAAMACEPALGPALRDVMARLKEDSFDTLIQAIRAKRSAYEAADPDGAADALARFIGAEAGRDKADLIEAWAGAHPPDGFLRLADGFARSGKKSSQGVGAALSTAARIKEAGRRYAALAALLLKADGAPKTHNFPTRDVADADPGFEPRLRAAQETLSDLRARVLAADRLAASLSAARLARAILSGYAQRKRERAALDYDDLIQSAVGLLTRAEARDWVRYKLDGGVEHILVDEAQDTSPGQWAAIDALAEEFFAGQGAERYDREPDQGADQAPDQAARLGRTIFAVGDEKQSIYSFQGAAPELLSRKGAEYAVRIAAAEADAAAVGPPPCFAREEMATSFRSTPAVLGFVDRVFASSQARQGLVFGSDAEAEGAVRHLAHRAAAPGQVDLWPLLAPAEKAETPAWDEPVDAPPPDDPKARLAELVAREIAGWIDREPLAAKGRPIRPGDVLVLVRQREPYSSLIIKALKGLGAPVAGADRLSLTEELAVKDLMALARFCLSPDDDLTVATLLRAPFCDVDEAALFDLAHRRPGRRRLFYELQERRSERPEYEAAYDFLSEMLRRADFERPYELFAHALGPRDGRRRLLSRLGPEAADPIDELMAEALRFERSGGPTLEAFALRLAQREIEIKREHEQGRDEIRVMTAHGAKGLEAPVVVLPDSCGKPAAGGRGGPVLLDPGAETAPLPPIWAGRTAEDPPALAALRDAAAEKAAEEHRRLLYVALTRAEDRLLICGAGRSAPEGSWYALCAAAMEAEAPWAPPLRHSQAPSPVPAPDGRPVPGWRLIGEGTPDDARAETTAPAPEIGPPPHWLWAKAKTETAPADIRPSDLGGADPEREDAGADGPPRHAPLIRGSGLPADDAAARGVLIHRLLERLPETPPGRRDEAAARLIAEAGAADADFARDAVAEALGVLETADLAPVFAPGSRAETPFAAVLPDLGPGEIHGVIDRLVPSADRVLIVDFKTGAVPAEPPEAYLRQLAVYRAAIARLYPGHTVETALLWTAARRLEHIPASATDAAFARAAAALDPLRADP